MRFKPGEKQVKVLQIDMFNKTTPAANDQIGGKAWQAAWWGIREPVGDAIYHTNRLMRDQEVL